MADPKVLQDLDATEELTEQHEARSSRRKFLQLVGAGGGAAALALAGCDAAGPTVAGKDSDGDSGGTQEPPPGNTIQLNFGTDIGVLNFAYALEQLEATFYVMACNQLFEGATDLEEYYLAALRSHENAHAVFLKNAIPEAQRIPDLEFDFSVVDFSSGQSVLLYASVFEDVGVSAYNGAGNFLENDTFLAYAGKIVSVEARHAAAIREIFFNYPEAHSDLDGDMRSVAPLASLGTVPEFGLDAALPPQEVLALAAPFIENDIEIINA